MTKKKAAGGARPAAAQPARLEILNSKGKVVQTWSGDVEQAAEIKKNLPPGRTARDVDA